MAFADPQTVTINSVANTLARVSTTGNASVYKKDDGTVVLTSSHQYGKRKRSSARIDFSKTAADPLISGTNQAYSLSVQFIIDRPLWGFTVAEAKLITDAFTAWLTASTGANVTKLLGGEN